MTWGSNCKIVFLPIFVIKIIDTNMSPILNDYRVQSIFRVNAL